MTVFNIINLLLAHVRSRFLSYEHIIEKRNENFRKAYLTKVRFGKGFIVNSIPEPIESALKNLVA